MKSVLESLDATNHSEPRVLDRLLGHRLAGDKGTGQANMGWW